VRSVQGQDAERVASRACGNSGKFHVEKSVKLTMRTRRFPVDQWSIFTCITLGVQPSRIQAKRGGNGAPRRRNAKLPKCLAANRDYPLKRRARGQPVMRCWKGASSRRSC